jgi:hypothetical protein
MLAAEPPEEIKREPQQSERGALERDRYVGTPVVRWLFVI